MLPLLRLLRAALARAAATPHTGRRQECRFIRAGVAAIALAPRARLPARMRSSTPLFRENTCTARNARQLSTCLRCAGGVYFRSHASRLSLSRRRRHPDADAATAMGLDCRASGSAHKRCCMIPFAGRRTRRTHAQVVNDWPMFTTSSASGREGAVRQRGERLAHMGTMPA